MFNTLLYQPIYNLLIFLINILPGHSVGLAIIILTIIVKFCILPLTHKSSKSQAKMKQIEPEVQKTRDQYKNDKQRQTKEIMDLYKRHGVNPFSGCITALIQLPIILTLYRIFLNFHGGVDSSQLYSFVSNPEVFYTAFYWVDFGNLVNGLNYLSVIDSRSIGIVFLGIFNLLEPNIILAFFAALTQFFQMQLIIPAVAVQKPKEGEKLSFQSELSKNMSLQMKYMMPLVIFFIAWKISAAIPLYWTVSNIFSIIHELIVKREADKLIVLNNRQI